jgi:hypothetical protein
LSNEHIGEGACYLHLDDGFGRIVEWDYCDHFKEG